MSWSGVKKHINNAKIEAWCDEMGIKRYTINSQGEIDVDGGVWLNNKDFKELPYKFGKVTRYFTLVDNKNLTSLKNCPDYIEESFNCGGCTKLNSLEGCPKEVVCDFWCKQNKVKIEEEYVRSLCNVGGSIYV